MLERTAVWVAISIFTGPLFVQLLRKEKEGGKWYDTKHKQEGIWRELCLLSKSLGASMG